MSFCVNCGAQISEQHKFCPGCGASNAAANTSAVVSTNQGAVPQYNQNSYGNMPQNMNYGNPYYSTPYNDGMAVRQSELETMDRLINYFSAKQHVYDEYDYASNMIYRLSRFGGKAALIWSIILLAASFAFFISSITAGTNDLYNSYEQEEMAATFVILGVVSLVAGGGLMGLFLGLKGKRRRQLVHFTDRYYQLSDELYRHYCGYANCPIGPEYTNPSNLAVVKRTIISGRAYTIRDALNILVEDAHRARMEDLATQTAQYAQQAAQSAQQIAANTNSIRRATTVTAVFTVANYFR